MADQTTPAQALKNAVSNAGGQSAFARLCGVSQPAVYSWLRNAKPLRAELVLKVEKATGVSRHALRPDLYPDNRRSIGAAEVCHHA